MTNQRDSLARWMTPKTSDAAVERMWTRIAEADERGRRVWPWAVGFAAVATAAAVTFMVWPSAQVLQVGAPLAAEVRPTEARFHDGSQVLVAQGGTVELLSETPSEMRVGLSTGSATFEVAKRPTRHFIVQADGVEVRVVGTRFTVRHDEDEVNVAVERGIVEVVSAGAHVRLTAGMSWSSHPIAAAAPSLPAPVAPSAVAAVDEPLAPAIEAPAPREAVAPAHRERAYRREAKLHASASSGASSSGGGTGPVTLARDNTESAAHLFETALTARRDGRFADAALALERILRDHADDSRAALAAFELGRLRMDSLPDLRGATEALELSLALSPHAQFAEEALLRLVKAYDGRGLTGPCVHARSDYLTRFPTGTYVESIKGYCGR